MKCPNCGSRNYETLLCEECDGTGLLGDAEKECDNCNGTGRTVSEYECQECWEWFDAQGNILD